MSTRSKFARPETKVIQLSDGDSITVKRHLTAGEQRNLFDDMSRATPDGDLSINKLKVGLAMVLAYLVDWTLTDEDGNVVEIRGKDREEVARIVDDLYPSYFDEIDEAVKKHDNESRKELAQRKNDRGGESVLSATSPSPVSMAGATTGSTI